MANGMTCYSFDLCKLAFNTFQLSISSATLCSLQQSSTADSFFAYCAISAGTLEVSLDYHSGLACQNKSFQASYTHAYSGPGDV